MFLVDTNVFLSVLLKAPEWKKVESFLNNNKGNTSTSILNLMEIVSVLSRKYQWKREDILDILATIKENSTIYSPDEYDSLDAYNMVLTHFIMPMDAQILSLAKRKALTIITYDHELLALAGKYCKIEEPS